MSKRRQKFIDILKGICILMIVWGHAKGLLNYEFITLAVPCFFIISGFLHNKTDNFKVFFIKKFKRLYIPFISCNLILPLIVLIKRFSLGLEIKNNIIYILKIFLTLDKDGFLFGASWFLGSLFLISTAIKCMEKLLKGNYILTGFFYLLISFIFICCFNPNYEIKRTIIGGIFYLIGILINNHRNLIYDIFLKYKYFIVISALFIEIMLWKNIYGFSYVNTPLLNTVCFIIVSTIFLFTLSALSKYIEIHGKIAEKILSYFGKNSLYILLFHFIFFEIINAIILKANNIPLGVIQGLPHAICNKPFCIFLYFIAGLSGSLLLGKLFNFLASVYFCSINKK